MAERRRDVETMIVLLREWFACSCSAVHEAIPCPPCSSFLLSFTLLYSFLLFFTLFYSPVLSFTLFYSLSPTPLLCLPFYTRKPFTSVFFLSFLLFAAVFSIDKSPDPLRIILHRPTHVYIDSRRHLHPCAFSPL
jgi:hypothetical protein